MCVGADWKRVGLAEGWLVDEHRTTNWFLSKWEEHAFCSSHCTDDMLFLGVIKLAKHYSNLFKSTKTLNPETVLYSFGCLLSLCDSCPYCSFFHLCKPSLICHKHCEILVPNCKMAELWPWKETETLKWCHKKMATDKVCQIEALGFGTNCFYFFCTSQVVCFVFLNCNVAVLSVESITVNERF
jgi:hypothetical protein